MQKKIFPLKLSTGIFNFKFELLPVQIVFAGCRQCIVQQLCEVAGTFHVWMNSVGKYRRYQKIFVREYGDELNPEI